MSTNLEECKAITKAVEESGVIFAVGHVLRYTAYSQRLKELLDSRVIGDIINIQHLEPVGWVCGPVVFFLQLSFIMPIPMSAEIGGIPMKQALW
jgi:hypothetical protein